MESAKIKYKLIEGVPDTKTYEALASVYTSIFKDADLTFFKNRIHNKEKLVSAMAFHEGKLVGFKIGYLYNKSTFYSWVGGVLLTYRKKGIAMQLARLQEDFVKDKGYLKIRTKSMNRFKAMMIINLKNGFNIIQVYTNDIGQTKIVFEKSID